MNLIQTLVVANASLSKCQLQTPNSALHTAFEQHLPAAAFLGIDHDFVSLSPVKRRDVFSTNKPLLLPQSRHCSRVCRRTTTRAWVGDEETRACRAQQ